MPTYKSASLPQGLEFTQWITIYIISLFDTFHCQHERAGFQRRSYNAARNTRLQSIELVISYIIYFAASSLFSLAINTATINFHGIIIVGLYDFISLSVN